MNNDGATSTPNTSWTDTVYLSNTGSVDANSIKLGDFKHYKSLQPGESYTASATLTLPASLNGSYNFIVQTDSGNEVFQTDRSQEVAVSFPVQIAHTPSDLVVTKASVSGSAQAGHQILVSWTVANTGAGDTSDHHWGDAIILSRSGVLGALDNIWLASISRDAPLAAGASYSRSEAVDLPLGATLALQGDYTLFVVADSGRAVPETSFDNNALGQPITIARNIADLTPTNITGPTVVQSGDQVTVNWTVANLGHRRSRCELLVR